MRLAAAHQGTELTVRDAWRRFTATNGLASDGGRSQPSWVMQIGALRCRMPNFAWRRRAIICHDVHHLVTGYACTPVGEFQMAAWEFAAGRFPSAWATLFCCPLVGIGAVVAPKRTFAAFVVGRRSRSLYGTGMTEGMLDQPLDRLRVRLLPAAPPRAHPQDRAAYGLLVAASLAQMLAPALAVIHLLLLAGGPG